jgi:hypothetical protein
MEGLGTHHSTMDEQRIVGHCVVRERSVVLDRRCPLAPQVGQKEQVCVSGRRGIPAHDDADGNAHGRGPHAARMAVAAPV